MIERNEAEGYTAAYMDRDWEPVDANEAALVKLVYDDGRVMFLSDPEDDGATEVADANADVTIDANADAGDDSEHQHHPDAWDKHRGRFAPRRIKIAGHPLATWARLIANQDAQRILAALQTGVSAGDSNTDIAHRVIGSAGVRGVNGATEVTRQHILRLGKGYLQKRKTRMGGAASDGRPGKTGDDQ